MCDAGYQAILLVYLRLQTVKTQHCRLQSWVGLYRSREESKSASVQQARPAVLGSFSLELSLHL